MKNTIFIFLIVALVSCNSIERVDGPQFYRTFDDVNIMFVDKGNVDKPAIIFIQGSDGTSFEWQVFSERLKDKYRLILFDRRGNGLSSRMLPEDKYSMEIYLKDIYDLQQKLEIDKCVILGWSFGGAVAAEYALNHPEKVSKAILVNPMSDANQLWLDRAEAVFPVALKNNDTLALKTIEKLRKGNKLTLDDEYEIVKVQNVGWYDPANVEKYYGSADLKAFGYNDSTISTDWENLIAQKKIYDGYSNLKAVGSIKCPVLIVGGTHDLIISVSQCKKLHSLIVDSELQIIQNSGHLPFVERPDELEKILVKFIGN